MIQAWCKAVGETDGISALMEVTFIWGDKPQLRTNKSCNSGRLTKDTCMIKKFYLLDVKFLTYINSLNLFSGTILYVLYFVSTQLRDKETDTQKVIFSLISISLLPKPMLYYYHRPRNSTIIASFL